MTIDPNSPAVQTHLTILQDIIKRMAGNSVQCKTWCITLTSAIIAVAGASKTPVIAWSAVGTVIVFCYLNALYLLLERGIRDSYNGFVEAIHKKEDLASMVFDIKVPEKYRNPLKKEFLNALCSWSVWPVYLVLLITAITAAAMLPSV